MQSIKNNKSTSIGSFSVAQSLVHTTSQTKDPIKEAIDKMDKEELFKKLEAIQSKPNNNPFKKIKYHILKRLKNISTLSPTHQTELQVLEAEALFDKGSQEKQSPFFNAQEKASESKVEKFSVASLSSQTPHLKVNLPSEDTTKASSLNFEEVNIPADGNCLYTSIFLGYLLPAVEDPIQFNTRILQLIGKKFSKRTLIQGKFTIKIDLPDSLLKQLQNMSLLKDLTFLKSKEIQELIALFRENMGLAHGLWGGEQEIKALATKLNILIEERTADPSNANNKYFLLQKTFPQNAAHFSEIETVIVLRTNPTAEESIGNEGDLSTQLAQALSAQESTHRQHFRLIIIKGKEELKPQSKNKEILTINTAENTNPSSKRINPLLSNIVRGYSTSHIKNKNLEYIIDNKAIERAKELFNALGRNKWKVYIDYKHRLQVFIDNLLAEDDIKEVQHQPQRRLTYDLGLHKITNEGEKITEKDFYQDMKEANERVEKNLGIALDFNEYASIHNIAMEHNKNSLIIRKSEIQITLPIYEQDSNLEQDKEVKDFLIYSEPGDDGLYLVKQKIIGEEAIKDKFNQIIGAYYASIKEANSNEQKLRAIAKAHLHLEWLHVFPDGNARVNKLILNKFLAENELDLCILNTPLGAEHTGIEAWLQEISQGQKFWRHEVDKETPEKIKKYQEGKEDREKKKKEQEINRRKQQIIARKMGIKIAIKTEEGGIITSSSDDEETSEEVLTRAIKRLKVGKINDALDLFKEIDYLPLQVPDLVFKIIPPIIRKNQDLGLAVELVNYFTKNVEKNSLSLHIYEVNKLRLFAAESFYELFLISEDYATLKSCLLYLDAILNNIEILKNKAIFFKLKIESFIQKITIKIPGELADIFIKINNKLTKYRD